MKKKVLSILLALFAIATTARAQVVLNETNFPDANFRAALASKFGISEGDEITEAKIAATTSLDVNGRYKSTIKRITDLTGIEYFTALKRLKCYENQLTSLDVSKNTALTELQCYKNQLTSLDVSECTALTTLECDNNQLTSLNVSGCTVLTTFECGNNQLAALDVSKNTAIKILRCYSNLLTTLDVSKNTELEDLNCSSNQLTMFDVSNNTALTRLVCYGNQLTNLDVSGCTALTSLLCHSNQLSSLDVSNCPMLQTLHCDYNQLTSLDVSQNTELRDLRCDENQLALLDVSQNSSLESLSCSSNYELTSLDLSNKTSLTELYCNYLYSLTSLDVSGCTSLTNLYCEHGQLTSLNLSGCSALTNLNCNENQLTALNVTGCTALSSIDCRHNKIKGNNMLALVNSLPSVGGGSLSIIDTNDEWNERNFITKEQVEIAKSKGWRVYAHSDYAYEWTEYEGSDPTPPVGIAINEENFPDENFRNVIFADYDLDGNYYLSDTEIAITDMSIYNKNFSNLKGIELFSALTSLSISDSQLITLDVSKNTALTSLSLSDCQLTSLDVTKNTALTYLNCAYNPLTTLDVSKNTALTTLYCGGGNNQLNSLDVSANSALKVLNCSENQLTSLDVSHNIALTQLVCDNNQLTSLDVSKNTALKYLKCYNNQLTSLDVSNNTELYSLDCYDNQLTSLIPSESLRVLMCHNNQLASLDVSNLSLLSTFYCYNNKIKETEMENLINGLNVGTFIGGHNMIKNIYIFSNIDEEEGNVCTPTQVKTLLGKKWEPYYLAYSGFVELNDLTLFRSFWGIAPNAKSVEFNEENFPDANFRKVISNTINIQEGETLTPIDLSRMEWRTGKKFEYVLGEKEIENLKGIEYFVALEELSCPLNQLISLDMSKNTALIWLECYSNQIKGEAMDALVASLPTVENGKFYVIDTKDENEGNVCTKSQLTIAKEKGWTVYDINGYNYQEYEGSNNEILLDAETFPDDNFRAALAKDLGIAEGDEINTGLILAINKIDVSNGKVTELSGIEYFTALTTIYCQSNMIPGNAMKGLFAALPDLSSNEAKGMMRAEETNPRAGAVYALDFTDENEQNVCTEEHVAAANEKGWTVYCKTSNGWQEYNGEIPTGINSIDNSQLIIDNWYSVDGVKLQGEPMRKGVYIVNGRKVVK